MTYDDLEVNMRLLYHQIDGSKKIMKVVRKGVDGFGQHSVVFQSTTTCAQAYCIAKHVPIWNIEEAKTIRLISINIDGIKLDRTFTIKELEKDFRDECMLVPSNDDEIKLVEINGTNITDFVETKNSVLTFGDIAAYFNWE